MSFTPILVLVAGILWLKEIPTNLQMLGTVVVLIGTTLFFSPGLSAGEPLGLGMMVLASVNFAFFWGAAGDRWGHRGAVEKKPLLKIKPASGAGFSLKRKAG
jgi:drug/metabolite transporter (DMT)-like permease